MKKILISAALAAASIAGTAGVASAGGPSLANSQPQCQTNSGTGNGADDGFPCVGPNGPYLQVLPPVTAPPATTPPPLAPLPATGSDVSDPLIVAGLAAVTGIGLVLVARKRRTDRSAPAA